VPLDYRSDLVLYRNGEQVKECSSTVNSPCGYEGYSFYQSAWYGFGAALEVKDTDSGNVVYRETLALSDRTPAPHVIVRDDSGALLLNETVILTDGIEAEGVRYVGRIVELPNERRLAVGLRETGEREELLALEPEGVAIALAEGESGSAGGLNVTYAGEREVPSLAVDDLPMAEGTSIDTGDVLLQLGGVIYGTEDVSAGDQTADVAAGEPVLTISGLDYGAIDLSEGESVTVGPYEYRFLGQREFSGIQVKRDRSDYLVWGAAALIVVGLMITFWVPRRRLWAKISSAGSALAGQAPAHADYSGELRRLARAAGAPEPDTDE
jgi:hypothetical protein